MTGQQIFASDGSIEDRALYKPYYKGFEPRLGAAWSVGDRWVVRGGYGISQFMEGTGANLRLPLNPPFFFESAVNYDTTTGAGSAASGFAGLVPGTTPSGNVRAYDPNLRPQFSQQWNAFVEYQVTASMSAQVGYVGHHADHLVTPVEGNQALPGVGDPATWAPKTTRRPLFARPAARDDHRDHGRARRQPPSLDAGQRAAAQLPRRGADGVVHPGQHAHQQPRLLRRVRRHRPAGRDQRHRGRLLAEHLRPRGGMGPGVPRRPPQRRSLSGTWQLPIGQGRRYGTRLERRDRRAARRLAVRRHHQGPLGPAGHGDRRPSPVAAGRSRRGAPQLRGRLEAGRSDARQVARHHRLRAAPRGTFGNCPVGVARAPGYKNVDVVLSKRFAFGDVRYGEFRVEAFNVFNIPSFGPPARDIAAPNTFGQITSTISAPRVVELVFKVYF